MKDKFILFDFDGVIVDSYAPALEVQRMICPHLSEEEYKARFEGNINEYEAPINAHRPECRLDLDFFELYVPKMEGVSLVPGMREVIEALAKTYVLIVISSTITGPIESLLEKHDLRKYFTQVMGNDVHKSKVEKIKMVFERYHTGPDSCVFVTDTLGDMREATKMAVPSIGVVWGFNARETLQKGNPFRLVETPSDIVDAIQEYF
jgi:phosphoglycolate phosphatase